MKKIWLKITAHARLTTQIGFVALSNSYFKGFAEGRIYQGKGKQLCLPGLNCYSCPGALGSCPIGSLQTVIGSRGFNFPFYVIGLLLIFGVVLGRFICGFLCPFGLVQDLLHKIPLRKKLHNLPGEKFLRFLKYIVLIVFVLLLPLLAVDASGLGTPYFCKFICPSGTLMGGVPLVLLNPLLQQAVGWLYAWKMLILVIVIVLAILLWRPFCRYLCPLGAIYSLFNPIALLRFTVDSDRCTNCRECREACPLHIPVYVKPNHGDCMRCGRCKRNCPNSAIHYRFGR
jgi:polyferredoxin